MYYLGLASMIFRQLCHKIICVSILLFLYSSHTTVSADHSDWIDKILPSISSEYKRDKFEGFGKYTIGGNHGRKCTVSSLADSGPGTLRHCVDLPYARFITFDVSGIIRLDSSLVIDKPFLSILGQTAPGDGITLTRQAAKITNRC